MRYILILIIPFLFPLIATSQNKELRAYLDSKQFYAPSDGNYVEFYLQFVATSINYTGENDGLIGELAIQMSITQNDKKIIADAYRLKTPFMKDSILDDFYDVKRFALQPGKYTFSIQLQDLNSNHKPLVTSQQIIIDDLSKGITISDIQVAEVASPGDGTSPFFKSGYDIIPRLATFYPEELTSIPVYFEIYNSNFLEDSVFAIKQTIVNALTNEELEKFTHYSKLNSAEVVPYLKQVDIADLVTGKYILKFTLINKKMTELSSQSYDFDRSNDIAYDYFSDEIVLNPEFQASITDDSIGYYLESLIPISEANEIRNILKIAKNRDADNARKYIQRYWLKTAPKNTYEHWMKYKTQVQSVQRYFGGTIQKGHETDRGRVYLKYGAPTRINRNDNSATEYPYEIWEYNRIGAYNNKKFIFYNPNIATNSYILIHSDLIGEVKDPNWPQKLSRSKSNSGNQFGNNSRDMFRE
ncbi:MAG TPA: GWxTD domain-containing protein [Crocinitomicaceae bacterium]|nr:GWxTD domain-containing protein [Crocinitomicaceae bacterium]